MDELSSRTPLGAGADGVKQGKKRLPPVNRPADSAIPSAGRPGNRCLFAALACLPYGGETTKTTAALGCSTRLEAPLTRDDHVQLDGVVTQVFAGGQFEVKTDHGAIVRAQLSGRMRKNRIRVILGDRVTIALSPYDLTHGMITYRHK
jgi:translation initiation factor IF-1